MRSIFLHVAICQRQNNIAAARQAVTTWVTKVRINTEVNMPLLLYRYM